MSEWSRVKWSDARQITRLLDWPEEGELATGPISPRRFFERLRGEGLLQQAVYYLGQALPRLEVVAWGARVVRDTPAAARSPAETQALRAALLWIQDPVEVRRRACGEAAEVLEPDSPERFVAYSVFYSGGSVAPLDCPAVTPPRDAAGRFATGGVLLAAARSGAMSDALQAALEAGDLMASHGLDEAPAA
jgi:hypothetical protein